MRLSTLHVYRENNTVASLCMNLVCQIFAKYLVCAIDCHSDSPMSLPISHYRVVLTYNCKAQCKREVCKSREPKLIGLTHYQRATVASAAIISTSRNLCEPTISGSLLYSLQQQTLPASSKRRCYPLQSAATHRPSGLSYVAPCTVADVYYYMGTSRNCAMAPQQIDSQQTFYH